MLKFDILKKEVDPQTELHVFGYIRAMERSKTFSNNIIPPLIYNVCLAFYHRLYGPLAIKEWMILNEVWREELYSKLLENDVKSEQDLEKLNERRFDDIIREVRVNCFRKLKDQNSRIQLDRVLIKFEKLWRKMKRNHLI